jgi:hypothetical protein
LNIKISNIIHQYYYPNIIQNITVEPQNACRNIFLLKRIVPIKSIYKTPVKTGQHGQFPAEAGGIATWQPGVFSPPDGDGRESHPSPVLETILFQSCFPLITKNP